MIYVTGDTHRQFNRLNKINFPESKEMIKDDYVIICGDFGGVWLSGDNSSCLVNEAGIIEETSEHDLLDSLEKLPFTLLFVDGNHESFDLLNGYPIKTWHGGLVHEIRPHVLRLMRGQVFDIEGKKCFTFGGAKSIDTWGGIFEPDDPDLYEKVRKARMSYEPYRINHESWWKEEEPSVEEMQAGLDNLEKYNWKVDFVFSHDCPASTAALLYSRAGGAKPYELTQYLEEIRCKLDYKKWFFGHHHDNRNLPEDFILLYEQIIRIN